MGWWRSRWHIRSGKSNWVPYVMAFSCAQVVPVTLWHLLHPGKPPIKP